MSKLKVQADCGPAELESAVDEAINEFDTYFQGLGNDPVVRSERAIIKTFLHFELRVRGEGVVDGQATGG